VAYNFQTGNNITKLLTEYENVTQKVLFGNTILAALMSGGTMTSYFKMATVQEKAMCLLWFFGTNSDSNLESLCIRHYLHFLMVGMWVPQFVPDLKAIKSITHHGALVGRPSRDCCENISAIITKLVFRHHFNVIRNFIVSTSHTVLNWVQ
jgi:hypothetical protein